MADLTRGLFNAQERLKSKGIEGGSFPMPTDGREADPEVVTRLQGEEPSDWNIRFRKRFLRRLTLALVTFGSSAPRTEYLVERAAERLKVKTNIAVFHSSVFLLFPDSTDPHKEETHMLKVDSDIDVDKLQRVDELANSVGLSNTPVMMAHWQLQTIVSSSPRFGAWYWQLFSFSLSAPTAALLFFSVPWLLQCAILTSSTGGLITLLGPHWPADPLDKNLSIEPFLSLWLLEEFLDHPLQETKWICLCGDSSIFGGHRLKASTANLASTYRNSSDSGPGTGLDVHMEMMIFEVPHFGPHEVDKFPKTVCNGSYWDALFSFFLGLGVGVLWLLPPISPVFGNMVEFIAALFVSFLARVFTYHFAHLEVCFFAMAISGLVWLLPGQNLTIGVSEVVEGSVLTGSARIMKALVTSLQLGFGLSIGENLVWWVPRLEPTPCSAPYISPWFLAIWLVGFAFAANIFLRARLGQWFGMTLVVGVGYAVSELAENRFGTETATVLAAFAIGLSGTFLSFVTRDIPLSMILAGLQVLLPGGIGVQGVDTFLKNDTLSGIEFVMNMVIITLSITVGLLLSKIVLHDGVLGASKVLQHNHRTLHHEFQEKKSESVAENEQEEDQHMAI